MNFVLEFPKGFSFDAAPSYQQNFKRFEPKARKVYSIKPAFDTADWMRTQAGR